MRIHPVKGPTIDALAFSHWFSVTQISHDQCSAEKFAVEHEGTVEYEQTLPKLDQFTVCAWMRFTNHSGDHTVFTYARKFFCVCSICSVYLTTAQKFTPEPEQIMHL